MACTLIFEYLLALKYNLIFLITWLYAVYNINYNINDLKNTMLKFKITQNFNTFIHVLALAL